MLLLERHKHFFGSGVLACFGFLRLAVQFEFIEQEFAHLSGAVDIKRFACKVVDFLLQGIQFISKSYLSTFQFIHVDADSGGFHFTQHLDQWQFHFVIEVPEVGIGFESLPIGFFIGVEGYFRVEEVLAQSSFDGIEGIYHLVIYHLVILLFGFCEEVELVGVSGLGFFGCWFIRQTWRIDGGGGEFLEEGVELEVLIEGSEGIEFGFFLSEKVFV